VPNSSKCLLMLSIRPTSSAAFIKAAGFPRLYEAMWIDYL
jgi:hypothetical protein